MAGDDIDRSDRSASWNQESIREDDVKYGRYLALSKAANRGDWATAKRIFDEDPDALTAPLSHLEATVLHVAVTSSRNIQFLQKLIRLMIQLGKPLGPKNYLGLTPLHYAAQVGNTLAASFLVEADPTLAIQLDYTGTLPIRVAAFYQHEETSSYLLPVTLRAQPSLLVGDNGATFLVALITDGFYDLAIQVLEENPLLSVEDEDERIGPPTALSALAQQPQAFRSGTGLTFLQHFLYNVWAWLYPNKSDFPPEREVKNQTTHKVFSNWKRLSPFHLFHKVRDEKSRRKKVLKLLRSLVHNAAKFKQADRVLGPAARKAAECGILEFVEEVIKAYPQVVCLKDSEERNIFNIAVIHRQERIFNLIFQLDSWKHFTMGYDRYSCNILHHAAAFYPTPQISQIRGAALQMQRELQWFTAVENIVQPSYKLALNDELKTPESVFIESHQELVNEGEKWMKNTANSYTIVAALVVTITFAAALTAPGGIHEETGLPIFLDDQSFMIFAIANACALFSSTTSLLMFLGILTSRYSPDDFLKTLPMKLAIGLITLFFSIGALLVAFTASIHVMLSHRVSWIVVPIGLLACLPLLLFAFLQFPLLLELFYSAFGPSIFRKQSAEMLIY